jgi:ATP-dependent Lon protease
LLHAVSNQPLSPSQRTFPLVLLDEIDKVTDSGNYAGPAPTMLLLGLLEKENACRWRDLFLQAPCDLSKVVWYAAANSAAYLAAPLRDRFRIIHVDAPKREHLRMVLPHVAHDLAREWGLPAGALPELPASLVTSGVKSLRDLRQVARAYATDWANAQLLGNDRH